MVKLLLIPIAILSAVLYNLGGRGAPYNTKFRDFGCPLCVLGAIAALGLYHWSALISTVLLFGAMTTYWTPKKQPDVLWWNWLLTGFFYGVALLPFCWITGCLFGWLCYTISVAVLTCILSESISNVVWEERSRGFIVVICLPLLYVRA